jgi:DNA (cytosine-5)-methyltransferase 1
VTLTVGALFAGYGGLDMAVMDVLDAELAWYAEFDKAPAKVMAHHHPDVPNLWDVTKVDWSAVEPVDVITGGSPCQDLSHAGKRGGMTAGTRSNLWVEMREAIATIRPRLVVWENVRGAGSAEAASSLEQCPRCVGDPRDRGPVLRALGRVVGDLADLGYVGRFYGLRAADVGGAHGRFRYFLFATPADAHGAGRGEHGWPLAVRPQQPAAEHDGPDVADGLTLLPTPTVSDTNGAGAHGDGGADLRTAVALLPTPRATRGGSHTESVALLPTPRATDGTKGGPNQRGSSGDLMLPSAVHLLPTPEASDATGGRRSSEFGGFRESGAKRAVTLGTAIDLRWGDYADAIARAEATFAHRPAPDPTEPNAKGGHRLSPRFVEWLMGLPEGHVTNPAIGLTRNEQLKALGNGVVPPQAAAALRAYLRDEREATPP